MAELPFYPQKQWSRSRSNTLRTCARRLYYQVFLSWRGWNFPLARGGMEAGRFQAYRLGKMSSMAALRGTIIHNLIDEHLEDIKTSEVDVEAVIRKAVVRFTRALDEASDGLWKRDPKRYTCLHEVYYGREFDRDEEIARMKTMAERAAETLEESYCLAERLDSQWSHYWPGPALMPQEAFPRFTCGNWEMLAIPDLVGLSEEEGRVDVIDWKTGRPRPSDVEQLVFYSLALEAWRKEGCLPPPLQRAGLEETCALVYLSSGEEHEITVPPEARQELAARYQEDFELLQPLVAFEYDEQAGVEVMRERGCDAAWKDFAPCLNPVECRTCPYLQMCANELGLDGPEAGREFVNQGRSAVGGAGADSDDSNVDASDDDAEADED